VPLAVVPLVMTGVENRLLIAELVGGSAAVIWDENVRPTVPLGVAALVMAGAGKVMMIVKVAVPVPPLLVALKVTVEVPVAVGVPEITPVAVLSVRPAGSPVAP